MVSSLLNSGSAGQWPNRIGPGTVADSTIQRWYNPADFVSPGNYTFGNSGRNILVGPGFATADLSLFKQLLLTERMRLDLRWEAFNALNRTNLANPVTTVDSSVAGQIFSILYPMRRMQIGAHLSW